MIFIVQKYLFQTKNLLKFQCDNYDFLFFELFFIKNGKKSYIFDGLLQIFFAVCG